MDYLLGFPVDGHDISTVQLYENEMSLFLVDGKPASVECLSQLFDVTPDEVVDLLFNDVSTDANPIVLNMERTVAAMRLLGLRGYAMSKKRD